MPTARPPVPARPAERRLGRARRLDRARRLVELDQAHAGRSGLSSPVLITSARDGTGRMFIVEQSGRILVQGRRRCCRRRCSTSRRPCRRAASRASSASRSTPTSRRNRKFYVNFTNRAGNTVVREYKASASNPNRVAAGSGRTIIKIHQPFSNHNGGNLVFGPGGYLYIGMGDGGSGGDPGNRAQDTASCWARCSASTSTARSARSTTASRRRTPTSAGAGATRSGSGPPQPVAILVRPGDRRPVDRRRRPGSARRRSIASRRRRAGRGNNWAGGDRGVRLLQPVEPLPQGGQGAADARLLARGAVGVRSPAATCTAARRSRR